MPACDMCPLFSAAWGTLPGVPATSHDCSPAPTRPTLRQVLAHSHAAPAGLRAPAGQRYNWAVWPERERAAQPGVAGGTCGLHAGAQKQQLPACWETQIGSCAARAWAYAAADEALPARLSLHATALHIPLPSSTLPCAPPLSVPQLVGISWTVGPFVSTFLLLPPAQHLAVQAVSLGMVMLNNRSGGFESGGGGGDRRALAGWSLRVPNGVRARVAGIPRPALICSPCSPRRPSLTLLTSPRPCSLPSLPAATPQQCGHRRWH